LKLLNFLKRKGDNDDAVTGASKQSKSSFIDNVEIVHASPASKAVKWKSKVAVAEEKYFKRQFQDSCQLSDFSWLVYENDIMTCKFCKTFPSMARNSDSLKGCKTFNSNRIKSDVRSCLSTFTLEHLIRITKNVAVEEYDPEKNLETWFSRERKILNFQYQN
jgi:hypothetical protein